MMRILVTGGAGFIGSHLVERLLAEGYRVRALDNLSSGKRANVPAHDRLEFLGGDIRDAHAVTRSVAGVGAVFHLAAVASIRASAEDPIGTHATNFTGTLNLLEAARRAGTRRFVLASSAAVYGDGHGRPLREDAPARPRSPYAADKLASEHYLGFYGQEHGLATTAFRFFNVYGPRQDPSSPYAGVVSVFIQRVRRGEPAVIFGDGRQTRDFVYVGDLVEILVASLGDPRTCGKVLNVGRGVGCSLLRLLAELERLAGRAVPRRYAPARAGDVRHSRADVSRLRAAAGCVPATPLRAGLARLLDPANAGFARPGVASALSP